MRRLTYPLLYAAVTGAAVGVFLAIRTCGEQLPAPRAAGAAPVASPRVSPDALFHVLLALVAA